MSFKNRLLHRSGNLEPYNKTATVACQILGSIFWTVTIAVSVYYGGVKRKHSHEAPIWTQSLRHPNPFTLDATLASLYWVNLFILQFGLIVYGHFSKRHVYLYAVYNFLGHFIVGTILHALSLLFIAYSHFIKAEIALAINFINLTILYFRHSSLSPLVHAPFVAGPLAWTFVALYWIGSCALSPTSPITRFVGNVFIWAILNYGLFFAFAYRDYIICVFLSLLSLSIAVYHVKHDDDPIQWISPSLIASILYVVAPIVAVLSYDSELSRCNERYYKSEKDTEYC